MKTGEGKTLVASLALYLNALAGKGVHLVTVNDYLARRDAGWMAPIYHLLGLSVGVNVSATGDLSLRPRVRRRDAPRPAPAAPAAGEQARGLPGRHHVRDQLRARASTTCATTWPATSSQCSQRDAQLRDRRRGRLDPHRRGADAAHHLRPVGGVDREVLRVRALGGAPQRGRGLRGRPQAQVRLADRGGHREDGALDRHPQHLRPRERHRGAPDQPGAQGEGALPARPRLPGQGRRGRHRRRVHRPHDAGPPLVRRPAPGGRGQRGREGPAGAEDASPRSPSRTTSASTTSSPA